MKRNITVRTKLNFGHYIKSNKYYNGSINNVIRIQIPF